MSTPTPDLNPADALTPEEQAMIDAAGAYDEEVAANTLARPDITPAQIVSFAAVLITSGAVIVGLDFTPEQLAAIDNIRDAAIALFAGDAVIRVGRALGIGRRS